MSKRRLAALSATVGALLAAVAISAGAGAAPTQEAPRNTSPPTLSGTVREGETLTANPGTWSGDQPITFTFQWFRCNAQLGDCQAIPGAISNQYTLTQQDVGRRMLVNVTATNSAGSGSAQASTDVVQARGTGPQNTAPPTISGTPTEGQTLTATNGTWTGTQPITFSHQWLRCDRNGGACAAIGGATAQTYRLTTADVGNTIRVRVTARNEAGSSDATSAPSAVIQPAAPPGPAGQIRLPNGKISIPVSSVSPPHRLVIDAVAFTPNPVRSRSEPITARFHVSDTRGFVVRGALVFVRSVPLLTTTPGEQSTATDGWVSVRMFPRLAFPLRTGFNVQFFARARKSGDNVLAGVSTRRLVQVRTASAR
jgi:hypothetical protein